MSKMDKYEDKEASMDDYSHEKKLGAMTLITPTL